ncbi:MAG: 4-oxalocrotonate tautomerase [Candidatus Poribacteria bacterium]|nr:4-oxalocrotonate tautomerase [Candidatus Poribacteria bacterium]
MPVITVEGGKIDVEKKRLLVKKLTDAASEVYALPKEAIIVLIKENSLENVGSGGVLISDKHNK